MRTTVTFVALVVAIIGLVARAVREARRRGYQLGGEVVVRCRDGHLFTTIWVPVASIKAVRLGWVRFQYCPVGAHLTFVTPVRDADLTDEQRRAAARYHDVRVP